MRSPSSTKRRMKPPGSATCQRLTEQLQGLVLFAVRLERDHLQHHRLEPFIRPALGFHLLAIRRQHRQRCGGVPLRQEHPGLAERELILPHQLRGCGDLALSQQDQHLDRGNLRQPKDEVPPLRSMLRLGQNSGCTTGVALGQLQAGHEHFADDDPVNRRIVLPRQFDALPPVLLRGLQVVPLVAYAGQAEKLFAAPIRRFLTEQLQGAPVAFGRLIKLVVRFLYLGQAGCGQNREVNIPGRLPDSHGFAIDPAGRGTVPLELVTKPQGPRSSTAVWQAIGVQVLEGAARLNDRGVWVVPEDRQSGSDTGNLSDQVAGVVIRTGILPNGSQSSLSRLQFLFDTGCLSGHQHRRARPDPQPGPGIQCGLWQRIQPVDDGGHRGE